jgi:hypothetical protein
MFANFRKSVPLVLTLLVSAATTHALGAEHDSYPCQLDRADWLTGEQLALVTSTDRARDRALTMLKNADDAEGDDGAVLKSVISQLGPVSMGPNDRIAGDYKCRKLQTDGGLNIAYGYFSCKISNLGEGDLEIEKLSGSQRFLGNLRRLAVRTENVSDEPRGYLAYNGMYHTAGDPAQIWDKNSRDAQVGCLAGVGSKPQGQVGTDGRMVLLLPPQEGYRSFVAWEFVPE